MSSKNVNQRHVNRATQQKSGTDGIYRVTPWQIAAVLFVVYHLLTLIIAVLLVMLLADAICAVLGLAQGEGGKTNIA